MVETRGKACAVTIVKIALVVFVQGREDNELRLVALRVGGLQSAKNVMQ